MSYDSRVDTWEHIHQVRRLLGNVVVTFLDRADDHDQSKLRPPEVEVFDEFTPKLADLEYGSEEYEATRKAMGSALEHHYHENSHHPEHFAQGIAGMSLIDLTEMLVDWKAASMRHTKRPPMPAAPGRAEAPQYDSDMLRSIEINQQRFGYGDEVKAILVNTALELDLV